MRKHAARVLALLIVSTVASVALAEKKAGAIPIKIVRVEGKADEVVIYPTEFTFENNVVWTRSRGSSGDDPALEFTSGEAQTLTCELLFDTYEERTDVRTRYVKALEALTLSDPALKRPPLVQITFPSTNMWGSFSGVLASISTKYTLFLTDGTPVRATTNVRFRRASSAAVSQDPCP